MPIARVKLGLLKHFNQIIKTWAGRECTHVIITETIDDFANIIDQSRIETTVYGIIGDANFKGNEYPIGLLQPGDLCGTFKYSDNIIISDQLTSNTTRQDHIIFESNEYRVENMTLGYDVKISEISQEPVIVNYLLRRLTI